MSTKVKMLLVGSVGNNLSVLKKKLISLHSSKAGPFDICFCVGSVDPTALDESSTAAEDDFPIPVYFQQRVVTNDNSNKDDNDDGIVSVGKNLFYLHGKTDNKLYIFEINVPGHTQPLLVGCCPQHVRAATSSSSEAQEQQEQCDILLSLDWPQGMEDVLNVDTEPLSYDVAEIAVQCRPRYHVCPSTKYYHASPPYSLPNSDHVGRFLALAPVTSDKPTKTTKFIHALGLVPLKANPPPTTAPSTLPCPFLAQPTTNIPKKQSNPLPEFARQAQANGPSSAFSLFAKPTNKRQRQNKNGDDDNEGNNNGSNSLEPPDDPNICTLFLYGLHKDVTGQLQSTSSPKVLQAFSKYGCTKVRHPPNAQTSTYCFIEFPSQSKALECILDCQGSITIDNVDLTLKWAAPKQQTRDNNSNKRQRREEQQHFVTQEEAKDSTTLFFHPPKTNDKIKSTENDDNKDNSTDEPPAMEEGFAEKLREYLEKCLEDALNEGVGDDNERVTAETEPALKVEARTKEQYGFLEFASHAAATMALAAVTKSTDGGLIVAEPDGAPAPTASLVGTTLRWAKGAPPAKKKGNREEVLEALGMKRQYYPADNRTDCWFCLSSSSCETHLITGVYDEWYAAMPKGPVHPGHILVVPITHTNEGAWNLDKEWIQLVDKLQQHAAQAYEMDLFVFERAMETKGGYHTHIQCVPIPRDSVTTLQGTMLAHAKASGFDLRPIQSDLGVKALINKDDSYFYAEVRTRSQNYRFLYRRDNDDEGAANVPLQFAREVLASVLKNAKLAHWKACVVDKEQEAEITSEFRTSFNSMG
jgi:diadenosine tetraphosphate (Ap4A) HIT family hydrolase